MSNNLYSLCFALLSIAVGAWWMVVPQSVNRLYAWQYNRLRLAPPRAAFVRAAGLVWLGAGLGILYEIVVSL